jgi:SAM-dependent methyltransferase
VSGDGSPPRRRPAAAPERGAAAPSAAAEVLAPPADLVDYYSRRAPEYDDIYRRREPARRAEQRQLAAAMRATLDGRRVLEVACGTGYWTAKVAPVARAVTAVDASAAMLVRARARRLPKGRVELVAGDAFALDVVPGRFDGGLANFWLSHVPRAALGDFLDRFHARLEPGAAVFLADNVPVAGVGGELVEAAEAGDPGKTGGGDTYKLRRLADGSRHRVLKNYFGDDELESLLAPRCDGLALHRGGCFWWASYRTHRPRRAHLDSRGGPPDAATTASAGGGR